MRINPDDANVYNNRGVAYRGKEDYDKAIVDYNEALRINPNDANAYNHRAAAYVDKANADYDEALRINPDDTDAYNSRRVAYYDREDNDKAITVSEIGLSQAMQARARLNVPFMASQDAQRRMDEAFEQLKKEEGY